MNNSNKIKDKSFMVLVRPTRHNTWQEVSEDLPKGLVDQGNFPLLDLGFCLPHEQGLSGRDRARSHEASPFQRPPGLGPARLGLTPRRAAPTRFVWAPKRTTTAETGCACARRASRGLQRAGAEKKVH